MRPTKYVVEETTHPTARLLVYASEMRWENKTVSCIYGNSGSVKATCLVDPHGPSVYVLNQCLLRDRNQGIVTTVDWP